VAGLLRLDAAVAVAPQTAGLFADYYASSNDAWALGDPVFAIGDGWSARATSGLAIHLPHDATVAFGRDHGGIGSATSRCGPGARTARSSSERVRVIASEAKQSLQRIDA